MEPQKNDGSEQINSEALGNPASLELPPTSPSQATVITSVPTPNNKRGGSLFSLLHFNKLALTVTTSIVGLIVVLGIGGYLLSSHISNNGSQNNSSPTNYATTTPSLKGIAVSAQLKVGQADQLVINGQLQVNNTLVLSPSSTPTNPTAGEIYYDKTTNSPQYFNGTAFVDLSPSSVQRVSSLGGASGSISLGNGLQIINGQLSVNTNIIQTTTQNLITGSGSPGQIPVFNGSQILGASLLSESSTLVSIAGDLNTSGSITAGNGIVITGNSSIAGNLTALTGLTSSGTITFSGLNSVGVVHNNANGVLSTGLVKLGIDTSGSYISNLGTLTGLTTTGNTGAGSTPTLSVSYGSVANTSVQGNTTLTCASGTGNLSGGGNVLTLGNGGNCGNLTITNSPTFSGTLGVQGSGGVTIGVAGSTTGVLNLANSTNSNLGTLNIAALGQATTYTLPDPGQATASICLTTNNCTAVGVAGGDLTGSYPNPTIAKLQGTTLTLSSVSSGQILQYNGTAFVNNTISGDITINGSGVTTIGAAKVTNADLVNSSITLNNGTNITGGGAVSLGSSLTVSVINNPSFSGLVTASSNTTALSLSGTPTNSATASLIQVGSALVGGNSSANGGTYIGINEPSSGAGSAADFLNFENNGSIKLQVTSSGAVTGGTYNSQTISSSASFTGTLAVATLGTANTSTFVCRNSSNQLATCNTTGSGAAFIQGGNSFGAQAVLGTNDSNSLALETNGSNRLVLDTSGNLTFQQASTISNASAATGTQLTIQGGASSSGTNVGGNLLLQGGAGASTGASGSVIVQSNVNNSTTAFEVQNAAGNNLLTGDTSNMRVGVDVTYAAMSSPTGLSAGTATSGGSLTASTTYYYKVTAIDSTGGETTPSTEASGSTTSANKTLPVTWTAVAGATGYKVYRATTSGSEVYIFTTQNNAFTDTGTITAGAAIPPSSTTAYVSTNISNTNNLELSVGGNGLPTGQLYVSGTVSSSAIGSVNFAGSGTTVERVFIQGKYAYVTSHDSNAFYIVDINNPAQPLIISTLSLSGNPQGLYVQGPYAYVVDTISDNLRVIGVSNPTSPNIIASINVCKLNGATPDAHDIYVQGRYAYIDCDNFNAIQVYDISNPASPARVGSISVTTGILNFAQGNYLYANSSTQLNVINISNPASPSLTGVLTTSASSWVPQGRYIYGVDGTNNKLVVVDISNPASPTSISTTSVNATAKSVNIQGKYAYVITTGSIETFDITNPYAPQLVGSITTSNNNIYMAVDGRYGYVVNYTTNSLSVYDLGGAYIQALQTGSLETTSLQTDSNANIGGDLAVYGGLQTGNSIQDYSDLGVKGNTTLQGTLEVVGSVQGGLTIVNLSTPGAPTITNGGTAGSTSYSYEVTALNGAGGQTLPSSAGSTSTGNATLTGANYNIISWTPVTGAVSYDVYRTASSGTPSSTGYIGNISSSTIAYDTGIAGGAATPTVNTTGNLSVTGNATFKPTTDNTTAFQIQNAAGTSNLLVADTTNTKIGIAGAPTAGGSTLQVTGDISLTTLDAANTSTFVCRNSSNQLATCNTTGSGAAFIQGGNSFGAQAVLGTNDSNSLALETNGSNRLVLDTSGNLTFQQASTISNASAATGTQLTIQGGASSSGTNVGGNLLLQGGAGASTGASGSVIVQSNVNNSTTAFEVQNANASTTVLGVDTTNGYVGIDTAAPSAPLDIAVNSSSTSPTSIIEQAGSGHAIQQYKTATNSFYVGASSSGSGSLNFSSSNADTTLGIAALGGHTDTNDSNQLIASKFTATQSGTLTSISVYVLNPDISPNNKYIVGIYSDSAGVPNSLLGQSAQGTVSASNGWNTASVSASLVSGTTYWITYTTNGSTVNNNNLSYRNVSNGSYFVGRAFGSMPASWPGGGSTAGVQFSMYGTFTPTSPNSFATNLFTMNGIGQTTFQNSADSTTALQIQNAAGTGNPLFEADTLNTKIGINTVTSVNSATLQVSGDIAVTTLDTANTSTFVCRNSSNQLATCNTTGSGAAFIQGGNSFGAQAVLGTNDNNSLAFRTNNTNKAILDTSGNLTFQQASTISNASAATGTQLTIQGGASSSGTNVGGNLLLQGGAGASTGASGSVIVQSNVNNSTTAFQVENASGNALLGVDTQSNNININATTNVNGNILFSDGFESGTTSAWTNHGLTVESTTVHSGNYAGASVYTGTPTYAVGTLSSTTNTLDYRAYVYTNSTSNSNGTDLLEALGSSNTFAVYMKNSSNSICFWNGVTSSAICGSLTLTTGSWHMVELRIIEGTSGSWQIYIDGNLATSQSGVNLGTQAFASIQVGEYNSGKVSSTVYFDDVSATIPTLLTVNGNTNLYGSTLAQNSANSTTAFQIQNASGANILNVDTSSTSNLLNTGDFESSNATTGWAALSGATLSQVTTQAWQGNDSLSVATTTTANDGAKYTGYTLLASQQYTLSLYAKVASSSISDFSIGRQDNTGTGQVDCLTSQTVTTSWTRFNCTFTTNGTINTNFIYVRKSGASAETVFIDGVQLQTGGSVTPFNAGGGIQLGGVVESPVALQNSSDSTTAFQIQNAAGTSNLLVADTTNTKIGIAGAPTAGGSTLQVTGDISLTTLDAANTSTFVCRNSSNQLATCNTTGSGAAFIQGGNSFGAQAVLGTNDSNSLALETNGSNRLVLDTSGNLTFQQASTISNASAATGTQLTIQGGASSSGTNVGGNLLLQGGAGASTGASGSVIVQSNVNNSTTAFEVQNAAGTSNLLVADTTNNKIGIAGAPTAGGSTLQVTGSESVSSTLTLNPGSEVITSGNLTVSSGAVYTGSIGGSGGTLLINLLSSGSTSVKISTGSTTTNRTLVVQGITNQTGDILNIDNSSSVLEKVIPGGSTTFTTPTNSITAHQIQNSSSANILNIDTSTTSNVLLNGDFEGGATTGWAALSGATLTQTTTQAWQGNDSLSVATTTTVNDGAKYTGYTLLASQQYTLSLYAKVASSSISDFSIGRQDNTGTGQVDCLTSQTVTTSWTRFNCTFTTNGTINTNFIYVRKSGASAETVFIDGVQLQTGGSVTPFNAGGGIQLGGVVESPVALQNSSDSTTAFQIQNAAGTSNLLVADTTNTKIGIAGAPTAGGSTLQVTGDISLTTLDAANTSTFVCRNSSNQLATCNTTGSGAAFIQGGNSFGAQAVLGTNDNNSLAFRTNNTNKAILDTSGNLTFQQASTISNASAATGTQLTIQGGASSSGTNVGGNLLLQGGAGASTGASGSVIVQSNVNNSTTAFEVQNASSANILNVDTATTSNLITNGDFEGGGTTGWSAKGSSTITQDSTNQWQGNSDLSIATTTAANDGATYNYTFGITTQYTLSLYAKVSSGSITDVNIGRQDNGSDINCLTAQTITTSWTRFNCTFTTGGTISGSNIYIKKTGASAETFFIDGVQLQTGASATPFNAGGALQFNGLINSPINIQMKQDSANALMILNTAGTTIFQANTLNNRFGIGITAATAASGTVLNVGGSTVINGNLQVAAASTIYGGAFYALSKTAGTGGVSANDPVILDTTTGKMIDTTTARDNRIYGVADANASSNTAFNVVVSGTHTVNVDTGAVNVGDQLVTSTTSGAATVDNNATTGIVGIALTSKAGGSTGTVSAFVRPVGGQYAPKFQNSSNSTTALQVQNASSANILTVDTSNTSNLVTNGDFEGGATTGWAAKGATTISQSSAQAWQGNNSLSVATTTAANDGAKYNYTFTNTQQYSLSFYAKVSAGSITDVNFGRQDDGSTDTDCATGQTVTTSWTRFTCTFTAGAQSGTPNLYIKKTSGSAETIFIDGVQLQTGASATPFNAGGGLQVGGVVESPVAFQNLANSTTAFQIQNAAGTSNLLVADTTNSLIGIGQTPTGAGTALQVTGGVTATTGNINATAGTLQTAGTTRVDNSGNLQNIGNFTATAGSTFATTGSNGFTFKPGTDNSTAFRIQNAGGTTTLFSVDTSGTQISLGSASSTPVLLVLGNKNTTGDPTEADGAIYYNSALNGFRCGVNGFWSDCAINEIDHSYVFEDDFLGGNPANAGSTAVFNVGSLGWMVIASTSCAVDYNKFAPSQTHDNPGFVRLLAGAANNDGCAMTNASNTAGAASFNNVIAADDVWKEGVALGAVNQGTFRTGWTNQASSTAPTSGAYWEYANGTDATHWRYCYANNGAATCAATTATISANTYYHLEIRIVSSSAITFIITPSGGTTETHALTSITYDLGSTNKLGPNTICYASTTTTYPCFIDYIQWRGVVTTTNGR